MSNSLDPDQARHYVGPDLGQNCLQSYQQKTKVATSGLIVKGTGHINRFSDIVYKGNNFCDFLFAFMCTKPLLKGSRIKI